MLSFKNDGDDLCNALEKNETTKNRQQQVTLLMKVSMRHKGTVMQIIK